MTFVAKSNGQEIDVEIVRKQNKNIYFRVKEDLKLYVYCPMYLSQNSILKLLDENESSIIKMYDKMEARCKDSELFWYLGSKYYIEISDVDDVTFADNKVLTPSIEALNKFYDAEVKRIFTDEVSIAKKCFNSLPEFDLKFRKMKTRWGVCNPTKRIVTLNTELLKKDITLLDYVIIHELCHFFEQNHSREFWKLVGMGYPNYKEARKRLRA